MSRDLGIYVHVPFCARKCSYCDFLSFPAGRDTQKKYFQALRSQIRRYDARGCGGAENFRAVSVYFGGGTPSLCETEEIVRTLELLRESFLIAEDAEITIECNPGLLDFEKLRAYRSAGINRLSIGLQSADDEMLRKLGRLHTFADYRENMRAAREAGFDNISADLMFGLPGQTREMWESTLAAVFPADEPEIWPEHVSAYCLQIEEGTPFYNEFRADEEIRDRGDTPQILPTEDDLGWMLQELKDTLAEHGIFRYEFSSYAKPGFESRHNSGYWKRREYLAFGLGASSQIGHERWKNTESLSDFLAGDLSKAFSKKELTELSEEDEMAETMFLGLRMMEGVSEEDFFRRFGKTMDEVYGKAIARLQQEGLLFREGGRVCLTERGIDLSNYALSLFLPE